MKTLRKYVLAFSSKVRNYLIPEDTNLVKLFNLGNCFGYFSRDIIEALILNILMYLWLYLIQRPLCLEKSALAQMAVVCSDELKLLPCALLQAGASIVCPCCMLCISQHAGV